MRSALGAAVLLAIAPAVLPQWLVFVLTLAVAKFLAVLGLALFLRAGLVSFGHALFYAVGAYTVAFAGRSLGLHEAMVLVPMAGCMGAIVAAGVGLFMSRYRGVFFGMLNLAVSMVAYALLLKLYSVTGGSDGIGVRTMSVFGAEAHGGLARLAMYYVALVVAVAALVIVGRVLASPHGYWLYALGDNEIRIEYSGESADRIVYRTYVLSGALGGFAGALVAFTVGHVVPDYAYWTQSGEFVFVALLGGFDNVVGPLLGSIVFEFVRSYAAKYAPDAWQLILGTVMLALILFRPGGLWTIGEGLFRRHAHPGGPVRG